MMRAAPYRLGQILDRMLSADKDLRYMAISDLMTEMERGDIKLDEDGEKKVCRNLLKLLTDKNSEVQNMVIKSLGFLTPVLDAAQVNMLISGLYNILHDNKPNEVSSTALKTIVTQLNPMKSHHALSIAKDVFPKVIELARLCNDSNVHESLDIISDLLLRFGGNLVALHAQAHNVLSNLMRNPKGLIRKKATTAIGNLAACCKQDIFNQTVKELLEWISTSEADSPITRSYIVGISLLAKGNANYFSKHLDKILPVLKQVLDVTEEDETREAIIQVYDTMYYRCPQHLAPYQDALEKTLLHYISYDPNYEYGDEGDDVDMDGSQYDDDSDNQYSDTDDDISWKVRRACAKALQSEIKHQRNPAGLLHILTVVAPVIVERFKERDQHVLAEIMATFTTIIHQIRLFVPSLTNEMVLQSDMHNDGDVVVGVSHYPASSFTEAQIHVLNQFNVILPGFLKAANKLKDRIQSLARAAYFDMLVTLTSTMPNILAGYQDLILVSVLAGVKDAQIGTQNKLNALNFLDVVMKQHDALEFKNKLKNWQDVLQLAMNDHFFRVVSESLIVLGHFGDILNACRAETEDAMTVAGNLFETLFDKLKSTKVDMEVLERSILCSGQLIGKLGDCPVLANGALIDKLVSILDKPTCEGNITHCTLRGLTDVARSPHMNVLLKDKSSFIMKQLANLISKGNRQLKVSALDVALRLLESGIMKSDLESINALVAVLPKQVVEADLQVAQMALKCLSASIAEGVYNKEETLRYLVDILQSHLLQGATLDAAVETVRALAFELMKEDPSQFKDFLNKLTHPVYDIPTLHKQAYRSISIAVAEVAAASDDVEQVGNLVEQLTSQMVMPAAQDNLRLFCIYTIGELGRRFHRVFENDRFHPENDLMNAFNMNQEELRIASAQSLGALAVGSLSKYLPIILEQIGSNTEHQYLLLHSLKEIIISNQLSQDVFGSVDRIWPVLVVHADCQEEGVRTVVAECLGRICVVSPKTLLPKLTELLSSPTPHIRYCAITAFKFIISGEKKELDNVLPEFLPPFLNMIKDPDMKVRRIALVVFNGTLYNKTYMVRDTITSLIPCIYADCKVKQELIREVEMGPFKHQVDDGIDVRKAAYECMFTILDHCIEKLDILEFIDKMEDGIKDSNHDIRLLTFMMLVRLSTVCPAQVLSRFDKVSEILRSHLGSKPKANAVKQEVEKLDELKRGVIRVVRAMQKIPDADRHPQLLEILNYINYNDELKALCEQVDKDAKADNEPAE